jgi:hypothetical protein
MKETYKKITTCSFLFVDHIILRPRNFFFFLFRKFLYAERFKMSRQPRGRMKKMERRNPDT